MEESRAPSTMSPMSKVQVGVVAGQSVVSVSGVSCRWSRETTSVMAMR